MADPIRPRPGDSALPRPQAEADAEISAGDIGRALAKWRRRVPDFQERLRRATPPEDRADGRT